MKKTVMSLSPILFALLLISIPAFGQPGKMAVAPRQLSILGTQIPINIYETKGNTSPITFVSLHHTEQLSLNLTKDAIRSKGGKLVEVVSVSPKGGFRRYLHFSYKNLDLCVDPNRIFSRAGIENSLRKIKDEGCDNNQDDEARNIAKESTVIEAVDAFARQLLKLILPKPHGVLVAVHNNQLDGSISLESFIDPHDEDEYPNNEGTYVARDYWPNKSKNEYGHEFFMASNRYVLSKLLGAADANTFSVALQKQKPDDSKGYLSTYCSWKGVNYVIIEAEHRLYEKGEDHRDLQAAMIDRTIKVFTPRPK